MLPYKQWKMLNESVMPSYNLGIAKPSNLGLQSQFALGLEESKKKAKKKMFGDDEDETGDGEMVEPSCEKDEPEVDVSLEKGDDTEFSKKCGAKCAKSKKNSKKKCGGDVDMDDTESNDQDKDDDEENKEIMFSKKNSKKSKKKMWSDEDDQEDMKDSDVDSEDEVDSEDIDSDDDEDIDSDEDSDDDGDGEFELIDKEKDPAMFAKKAKKSSKKKMTKESNEETEWWASVNSMMGNTSVKYDDGWTQYQNQVDDLFSPVDQNNLEQAVRADAGEVGFAPQQRMGEI